MRALPFSILFAAAVAASPALAAPVLMISIDGLRPLDVIDAPARGLKVPALRAIMADGAYATGVRNMLPTVTYPNHTTLITGVAPALHGISNNVMFDPLDKNMDGWYWYASDIKVPTLWDAVHAEHKVVASIDWPVSVGTQSIDDNIPEYWRALNINDVKLLHALSTPGLTEELSKAAGMPLTAMFAETPASDVARAKFAAALIDAKHPEFMTLHLVSLDATQHEFGPDTAEAHAALEIIDGAVGDLVAAARKAEPDLVVAIVSDHGFAAVQHDVNLSTAFVKAGLIKLDPKTQKPAAWTASVWDAGGSAAIVLKNPSDTALRAKVAALLKALAADPKNGIAQVIDRAGIDQRGGGVEAAFWVDFKLGYEGGTKLVSPLVTAGSLKGMHGYFPDHPEMRATFMIDGPGIPKADALGDIDMRDIAPTLAKVLGVSLPSATGKALF
jgi:predicted AlkP superfamily pyrophosphatase or phosphodiesterase